jgi:CheY-like chemotaxis protein
MSAKRALIVDDSKSARAFLARILEKYEIEVDTAESAEQAIEYLTKARPDVIFMDHMMPGMDGFQAVQSIKNNPRTATIPIMMYTSQEGELYLGQARALGAVGVLPKQIKPIEVSKVLYQLHLAPDRRHEVQNAFTPANAAAIAAVSAASGEHAVLAADDTSGHRDSIWVSGEARQMIEAVVRSEASELRRSFGAALDMQSERLLGDVRAAVTDLLPPPAPSVEPRPASAASWWLAVVASLAAAVLGFLWWRESALNEQLATRLLQSSAPREPATPRALAPRDRLAPAASPVADSGSGSQPRVATGARDLVQPVPYGEVPLAGERLEALRALLNELLATGFRGSVTVTSFPGRFCLSGSAAEGFTRAPDATLVAKCTVLGNPFDESLTLAQREPLALANLLGAVRKQSGGGIEIELSTGSADADVSAYPQPAETLTAAEWNRAAANNTRLEIRVQPAT